MKGTQQDTAHPFMKTRLLHFLLPMAFLAAARGGTHVWSGAGANTSWSNPANWSSGGVPVAGEAAPVKLVFPGNATSRTSSLNINNLKIDALEVEVTGGSYTFPTAGIPVTFTGAVGDNIKLTGVAGTVTWQPAITLQATCRVNLSGSSNLDIQGVIAGSGGLTKQGSGTLKFTTGSAPNTFTGTLRLEAGSTALAKMAGTACFAGKLEMAGGTCTVQRSHQIPDTSAIEIWSSLFSLTTSSDAVTETIGNVTIAGNSTFRAYAGTTLVFGGSISSRSDAAPVATIASDNGGMISFGGGVKTISLPQSGTRLYVDAGIGNGASPTGIVKTGAGRLLLNEANSFSGAVEVQAGELQISHANSLGTTAGATTVREGATLFLEQALTLPAGEKINLEGTLYAIEAVEVAGEVVLGGSPHLATSAISSLKMSGKISGSVAELVIDSGATVEWSGSEGNTYQGITRLAGSGQLILNKSSGNAVPGPVELAGGKVKLAASNQIADLAPVWFSGNGIFDLNGFSETVISAFGLTQGEINLGNGTLILTTNSSTQLGSQDGTFRVTGTAASTIRKQGFGTLTIYRRFENEDGNELTALQIESGKAVVFGYWQGPIFVMGATLEGSARTGAIVNQGGTMNLTKMISKGVSNTGAGGTYVCSLTSEVPGTGFGAMEISGSINLTGMSLNLSVGYLPMTGSTYTLLVNDGGDPVVGTFNGLPEGAVFSINGHPFRITYKAGAGGNDVMIRFIGTGTPGPEITALVPQANGSVRIDMKWEPGKTVYLERALNGLEVWGMEGSFTMDAQGKATFYKQVFWSKSEFFRLRTNPQ
jgi:fibronectin-binding autotransporter adhesin